MISPANHIKELGNKVFNILSLYNINIPLNEVYKHIIQFEIEIACMNFGITYNESNNPFNIIINDSTFSIIYNDIQRDIETHEDILRLLSEV
jgi:hypothetical protein